MMNLTMIEQKNKWLRCIEAVMICYVFALKMAISASNGWNGIFHIAYWICVVAELLIIFSRIFSKRSDCTAQRILRAYLIWLVISRPICGDVTLSVSLDYIEFSIFCVCFCGYGVMLDEKERRRIMLALAIIIGVFYFALAVSSLVVAVTRENIQLPMGIDVVLSGSIVTVASRNRNTVSMWYVFGICMAAYLFSLTRSKPLRAVLVVASAVFYAATSVSRSRLSILAISTALAMFAILPILDKLRDKKLSIRVAAALLTAVIVAPLSYKSYDAVNIALSRANALVRSEAQTEYAGGEKTWRILPLSRMR